MMPEFYSPPARVTQGKKESASTETNRSRQRGGRGKTPALSIRFV